MFGASEFILIGICIVAVAISWFKDSRKTKSALKVSAKSFMLILPFLVAVFILTGLLEVFVPKQFIIAMMGTSREFLAPVLAAIIGGVLTGPAPASYPLARFLLDHNASIAAVATFVIAWVAVGTVSLPIEIKLFGQRFAFTRWFLTIVFSVVIGLLMGWVM